MAKAMHSISTTGSAKRDLGNLLKHFASDHGFVQRGHVTYEKAGPSIMSVNFELGLPDGAPRVITDAESVSITNVCSNKRHIHTNKSPVFEIALYEAAKLGSLLTPVKGEAGETLLRILGVSHSELYSLRGQWLIRNGEIQKDEKWVKFNSKGPFYIPMDIALSHKVEVTEDVQCYLDYKNPLPDALDDSGFYKITIHSAKAGSVRFTYDDFPDAGTNEDFQYNVYVPI